MNSSSLKRKASDCVLNSINKFFKPISTRIESNDTVNCEKTYSSFDPAQGQSTYEFKKEPMQPRII